MTERRSAGRWGRVLRGLGLAGIALADLALVSQFLPLTLARVAFVLAKWCLAGALFETAVLVGRRRRVLGRARWVADRPQVREELVRYEEARRRRAGGQLSPGLEDGGELAVMNPARRPTH